MKIKKRVVYKRFLTSRKNQENFSAEYVTKLKAVFKKKQKVFPWLNKRNLSLIFIYTVSTVLVLFYGAFLFNFAYNYFTFEYSNNFDSPKKEINVSKDPEQSILNIFCYVHSLRFGCIDIPLKGANNKNYTLYPMANYKIAGIVIAKNTILSDKTSDISPIDIGLAWGKMALPEYSKYRNFHSSERVMYWDSGMGIIPLSKEEYKDSYSHNHLIPANTNIRNALMSLHLNEKVYLEGSLVFVNSKGMVDWNSSLSRTDKGFVGIFGGSCEIFYVTKVRIGNNYYE
ncbi:MAG: hypothetical protein A2039_03455 [Candidatus Melainabacteria bacterium GWA2_34_9]|nr:MAG: hypothetical protein A2039_03455 [Candidatus Melainabacteria bacterium GWA2_34_9]